MSHIVDWHSHVLPWIDDGSKDIQMSLDMLYYAKQNGTDYMIATPHFYADRNYPETFLENRQYAINALEEKLDSDKSPHILYGAETAWFSGIGNMEKLESLCISETNLLLLELPFFQWSSFTLKEIDIMMKRGIVPVIAHLERYVRFQNDKSVLNELSEYPIAFQFNAESLTDFFKRMFCLSFAKKRKRCLLGTDAHDLDLRKPDLMSGRTVLSKKMGSDYLESIDQYSCKLLGL